MNKNYIVGTFSIIVILTIGMWLTIPNQIFSKKIPDIILDDENFNGVHLNQNIKDYHDRSEVKDNPHLFILANGLSAMVDRNGNIMKISITHDTLKSIQTIRGIKIGDTLDVVISKYGNDFYNRTEQGVAIIRYKDEEKYIEFWHWNNQVQEIRLGQN